ncbi:MAG: aminopeptidase [Coriobacteriales bacterium]|jgi:aminopeptidase
MADSLEKRLENFAELIVRSGLALKEGQELFVSAPVQCADFTRKVVAHAYAAGARHVTVSYRDEQISRLSLDHAPLEVFEQFPAWQAERQNSLARQGAAVLTILSEDPDALTGVDQQKVQARTRASHEALKEYYDALDFGKLSWCIVGAASEGWATKVFPDEEPDQAVEHLWREILDTSRVDDDPIAAWEAHKQSFEARKAWLNEHHFDHLHYTAANGTDLTIGLIPSSHWEGGGQLGADGTYFFPNIPTEEIFTSPDRMRVDGIVYSALPLIANGARVEDFWVRFEKGRAVECDAKTGADVLQSIIDIDEGSCRLGECSLVPHDSPIAQTGILFFETLYDENASCHLAFGKGFPETLEGGYEMDDKKLKEAGVNVSATHVDFMVGTPDLDITGVTLDGEEIPVFRDGTWAFEI